MKAIALAAIIAITSTARADVLASQLQRADDSASHRWRIVAVIAGSLGAASVAVGLAHGIGAIADWHDLENSDRCDAHGVCNADGVRLTNRANSLATASDLLIGAGLLVLIGAGELWVTTSTFEVVPIVQPTTAGVQVRTRF
jgi:hypothetical protein